MSQDQELSHDLGSDRNDSESIETSTSKIADSHAQLIKSRLLGWHLANIPASRLLNLLAITAALGIVDGLQAKYMSIGGLGREEAIAYQAVYMTIAIVASYCCLFDRTWSELRNTFNVLVAIPMAALADNISIDIQQLKPFFILIPKDGYLWRINVFGNTSFAPLAHWVNHQFLIPGLINGYALAIVMFTSYFFVQHYWAGMKIDSFVSSKREYQIFQKVMKKMNKFTRLDS